MIAVKTLELRDRGTFIPAFAFRTEPDDGNPKDKYLLRRCGWGSDGVVLGRLDGSECHSDPYDWTCEPWQTVHLYLEKNWAEVRSGDVLDAEFLRGESSSPKKSEAYTT